MGMRIWHQSFTVLEDLPGYPEAIRAHAAKVLRPDTEIALHGQAPGTYPSNYPGNDIGYNYTFGIHGHQWIAAGRAAEKQGFDAYAMCTLPNPMLREARSMLEIPVIGMGETCCHLATMFGQRFAIMLFIDRMVPMYQEQIRQYGLTDRCAGVVVSGLGFGGVLEAYTNPAKAIEQFQESARKVIAQTGADVIIPGEVPLNLLMARNGISRVDDVPIVDGLGSTLKMAELMVDLYRATGIKHSRHGFFNSVPSMERVDEVGKFYGVDRIKF
ncbi:MAG: aspartate/glutamate racemase family protein [Rhodospirillales bacterium]